MSRQDSTSASDNGAAVAIILAAGMGLVFTGMWYLKHAAITHSIFSLMRWQLMPFAFLHIPGAGFSLSLVEEALAHPAQVSFLNFVIGCTLGSMYWSPFLAMLYAYSAYETWNHPVRQAYRELNASGLLHVMAKNFSYVAPVLKLGKRLLDGGVPGWESPLNVQEFAEKHALLTKGAIDHERAERLFVGLLGPRIIRPSELKQPHERALMSIFAEACWGNRKEAFRWLDKLNWAACNDAGKPDFNTDLQSFFEPHFKRWAADKRVIAAIGWHAYRETFLASLLHSARWEGNKGKLATSYFIWLRPCDRQLYYVLNQLGRDVPWPEGLHAWAQYSSECIAKDAGLKMVKPFVRQASFGLETELKKINWIKEETSVDDFAEAPDMSRNRR